ncbi:CLUMA_CG010607, isoform A [Clunio marinus]|uniref:CLUMA_CG010607, isoform A n=1 Tax=Clunio marinus TaxID=568069 RepID=A0A1J1IBT6_9DIPT|nr:CLUMA_CG010607, isoform A [Clunio marinus]
MRHEFHGLQCYALTKLCSKDFNKSQRAIGLALDYRLVLTMMTLLYICKLKSAGKRCVGKDQIKCHFYFQEL